MNISKSVFLEFAISAAFLLLERCAETKGRREEVAGARGRRALSAWRQGNYPARINIFQKERKKENFNLLLTLCLPKYQITMIKN